MGPPAYREDSGRAPRSARPRRCPLIRATLASLLCLVTIAFAGGDVEVDPRVVLGDLASIYREAPRVDDLRITVETITEKRTERITVRTRPGAGAEITLGPLTLWTDLRFWYAAHDDAPDAFARIPFPRGEIARTLEDEFPPILTPQIAWMSAERPASKLGGLAKGVTWAHASVLSPCGVSGDLISCATAQGATNGRTVTVTLNTTLAGEPQFGALEIRNKDGSMTIRAERTESHAPRKATLGIPLDGREALGSFEALLERVPTVE